MGLNSRYFHTHSKPPYDEIKNVITESRENDVIPEYTGTDYSHSYLNVNATSFTYTSRLNPHAAPFSPLISTGFCEGVGDNTILESPYSILQRLRVKNIGRILIGHINLNSIRHKFHTISDLIKGKIDIFLISETKIDNSFPNSQFQIHGYSSPFRLDRSTAGGGLLLYTRQDIPTRNLPSQRFGKN